MGRLLSINQVFCLPSINQVFHLPSINQWHLDTKCANAASFIILVYKYSTCLQILQRQLFLLQHERFTNWFINNWFCWAIWWTYCGKAHAYLRSHNPQTHERFYMRDRLGERLFADTFGFSKSNFEILMTIVAPSMESFETRGNPMPLYSKIQAALLVLKGNSFLSIAGNISFLLNNLKTDLPSLL